MTNRFLAALAVALVLSSPAGAQILNLPPRPAGAKTGSQIYPEITSLTLTAREQRVFEEIISGNVPDFLRTMIPVTVNQTISGTPHTATFYVIPDYLGFGTNADFFRFPMTPILARWITDRTNCVLPTRKMVDAIWTAASVRLAPSPKPPGAAMITVPYFYEHHQTVESQRIAASGALGALTAGDKKDVITSNLRLTYLATSVPNRVIIYGWHYQTGTPIQPVSGVHENTYADYSHGIRLVSSQMVLDGQTTTVQSVWAHPVLYAMLVDAPADPAPPSGAAKDLGPITDYRYPASPAPAMPYSDFFPQAGRELEGLWMDRFTVPAVIAFSPASPGGDGYAMRVRDASGGIDTTRLGKAAESDYFVEADIYCNYRPALAADGYERVGIFARDDGNGMFEGTSGGGVKGSNYALTWDSSNGRIQCLKTVAGAATDLLPAPQYLASSAWRRFRIEALGNQITFKVDGSTLRVATDSTFPTGQFGVGYHDYFTTNANIAGTIADNFSAGALGAAGVGEWRIF